MRLRFGILCGLSIALAACGSPPSKKTAPAEGPKGLNTNSPLAGKTLQCSAGGTASGMTFGKDGSVSGTLLDGPVTGTWYVQNRGQVEVHIKTGSIALRDILRPAGSGWRGRNVSCT